MQKTVAINGVKFGYYKEPEFDKDQTEILGQMPDYEQYLLAKSKMRRNNLAEFALLSVEPLLTTVQEKHLFRKMHCCYYNAYKAHKNKQNYLPHLHMAQEVRQHIANANWRLLFDAAKKRDSRMDQLLENISDGVLGVLRSVDLFDYRKGHKFSTYCSWAICNALNRGFELRVKRFNRYSTNEQERLDTILRQDDYDKDNDIFDIVNSIPDKRQKNIVKRFFGFGRYSSNLTQMGKFYKISKERARQLKENGLDFIKEQLI